MSVSEIHVILNEDDTAFFGPAARLGDYDIPASYREFEGMLTDRLAAEYPWAKIHVEVRSGPNLFRAYDLLFADKIEEELPRITHEVWETFNWTIEAD